MQRIAYLLLGTFTIQLCTGHPAASSKNLILPTHPLQATDEQGLSPVDSTSETCLAKQTPPSSPHQQAPLSPESPPSPHEDAYTHPSEQPPQQEETDCQSNSLTPAASEETECDIWKSPALIGTRTQGRLRALVKKRGAESRQRQLIEQLEREQQEIAGRSEEDAAGAPKSFFGRSAEYLQERTAHWRQPSAKKLIMGDDYQDEGSTPLLIAASVIVVITVTSCIALVGRRINKKIKSKKRNKQSVPLPQETLIEKPLKETWQTTEGEAQPLPVQQQIVSATQPTTTSLPC
jgi:hypothetical protein